MESMTMAFVLRGFCNESEMGGKVVGGSLHKIKRRDIMYSGNNTFDFKQPCRAFKNTLFEEHVPDDL